MAVSLTNFPNSPHRPNEETLRGSGNTHFPLWEPTAAGEFPFWFKFRNDFTTCKQTLVDDLAAAATIEMLSDLPVRLEPKYLLNTQVYEVKNNFASSNSV